jgi:hypothetical protein
VSRHESYPIDCWVSIFLCPKQKASHYFLSPAQNTATFTKRTQSLNRMSAIEYNKAQLKRELLIGNQAQEWFLDALAWKPWTPEWSKHHQISHMIRENWFEGKFAWIGWIFTQLRFCDCHILASVGFYPVIPDFTQGKPLLIKSCLPYRPTNFTENYPSFPMGLDFCLFTLLLSHLYLLLPQIIAIAF